MTRTYQRVFDANKRRFRKRQAAPKVLIDDRLSLPDHGDERSLPRRERSRPDGVPGAYDQPGREHPVTDPGALFGLSSRVFVAMALGPAIGMERQWRLRTAGIRTNALVPVGASLFVVMGTVGLGENPGADPTRVAAQVVSGIGFLGAGVILRDGFDIRGPTTAAPLWCAAAIGSLAGAGMEVMALIGCVVVIATSTLMRPVGRFVNGRQRQAGELPRSRRTTRTPRPISSLRSPPAQAVDRPEYTLRSPHRVLAGVSRGVRAARRRYGRPGSLEVTSEESAWIRRRPPAGGGRPRPTTDRVGKPRTGYGMPGHSAAVRPSTRRPRSSTRRSWSVLPSILSRRRPIEVLPISSTGWRNVVSPIYGVASGPNPS